MPQLNLTVEKLIPFFKSLSHTSDGMSVIFDGGIDSEEVEVEVIERKKDYITCNIKKIVSQSPHRIEPMCKYFGECGGCDLLYMTYEKECEEKEKIFHHYFSKFSDIEFCQSVFPGREKSRIRVIFHQDGGKWGFYRKQTNNVIDIDYCPLLCDELNTKLSQKHKFGKKIQKFIFSNNIEVGKVKYKVNSDSFFQSNLQCAEKMLEFVRDNLSNEKYIIDAYAGLGFFSKVLESPKNKIIAIEENPFCRDLGAANLKYTQYYNIKIENSSYLLEGTNPDAIIIDPPRGGMTPRAFDVLASLNAKKIIYISCAIDKSIKDIDKFVGKGYKAVKAQLYDMFPATKHIETICLLTRK